MKILQRHSKNAFRILHVGLYAVLLALGLRYYPALRTLAQASTGPRIVVLPQVLHSIVGGDDNHRATGNYEASGVPATSAGLQSPNGLAIDSHGNLYVADGGYGIVRRVNASDGTITTVAGGGELSQPTSSAPMAATDIQLYQPTGIAIGAGDVLYIADAYNEVIYRVDTSGNLTVVAGIPGSSGYSVDGTVATAAQLNYPTGVAVDAAGNIYFSEEFNHLVRRVNVSDGTLTTIAGNETLGSGYSGDGSAGSTAQLSYPAGIALDVAGNVFIADSQNHVIRKVDKGGFISTVAGNHQIGRSGDGGPATAAQIFAPSDVALDAAGQLYISDSGNDLVRKVAADGTISTVAGIVSGFALSNKYGQPATSTQLGSPSGITLDANGSLYISDDSYQRVFKAGPDAGLSFGKQYVHSATQLVLTVQNSGTAPGNISAFAASGTGYTVTSPGVNGCTVSTTLQPGSYCILTVTYAPQTAGSFTGSVSVSSSSGTQAVALTGSAILPTPDIELDITPDTIGIGDSSTLTATLTGASAVPTGSVTFVDDATGNTFATANIDANGIAKVTVTPAVGVYYITANYDGDPNYASNHSGEYVLTVTPRAATISFSASASTANAGDNLSLAANVTATSGTPSGSVDFRIDGTTVATAALSNGNAAAVIQAPPPGQHSLQAVYTGDSLYGTAFSNTLPLTTHGALLQFTPSAAYTLAGVPSDDLHPGFGGDGGPAMLARFHSPAGVASDGGGNIYIADEQNNVIRKVAVDGTITTVAGIPYAGGINIHRYGGDGGAATSAYFTNPSSVAVDAAGNLYIADYSNHLVRKVTAATGIITTIAGSPSHAGYNGDGVGTSSYLNSPISVAVDPQGNVYIADYGNNLVRKVDTAGNLTTVAGSYYLNYNTAPTNGPATSVALYHPSGVGVSPAGELYISDSDHNVIRKIDTSGNLVIVAGVTGYQPVAENVLATESALSRPQQIAFDPAGNLYFADGGNNIVRKVDTAGIITTAIGYLGVMSSYYYFDPAGAPSNTFQLVVPSGVAIDPKGNIIATNTFNQTILRAGATGALLFGPANGDSDPQTLTLTNAGDSALTFGANPYTVSGNYAVTAEGAKACNFTASLAPGASCTVTVRNHEAAGAAGSITFAANVPGTPTVTLKTNSTSQPSVTALYLSEDHGAVGDNVLLYGFVSVTGPAATGSVSFYDGSTLLGTVNLSGGIAYMYVSTLAAGTHNITAQYSGGGVYGASVSDVSSLVLSGIATSTTLTSDKSTASYGSSISFTATVVAADSSSISSGTVTFSDGGTTLGTAAVGAGGVASYSTASLAAGSHTITATYSANGSYMTSTSAGLGVTVNGGGGGDGLTEDYTITIDGLPAVIHRGESKIVAVTVQPVNNFTAPVQLSCGTLPDYMTCSFSPSSVFVFGGSAATSVLTITASPAPAGEASAAVMLRQGLGGALSFAPLVR